MSPVPLADRVSATAGSVVPSLGELQFGAVLVATVYGTCLVLHCLVPARLFAGYVLDADGTRPLVYRLNGLRVLLLIVVVFPAALQLLSTQQASPVVQVLRLIGQHYRAMLWVSCALGVSLSAALYARGTMLHSKGLVDPCRRCPVRGSDPRLSAPCPQFLARGAIEHFYW